MYVSVLLSNSLKIEQFRQNLWKDHLLYAALFAAFNYVLQSSIREYSF